MAEKLLNLTKVEHFQQNQKLLELQQRFVVRFADSLKQLFFAQFSLAAIKQADDLKTALTLIDAVKQMETVQNDPQANLLCHLEMAKIQVLLGDIETAKTMLEEGRKQQENFPGIMETAVYSAFHLASLTLYKATSEASKYFASAMLYLTYTPLEEIAAADQNTLAVDIGLAALLGDIYNFGELLQHPILQVLSSTSHAWVAEMLMAFNRGDIKTFEASFNANAASNPILAAKKDFLAQKVRVMALMDLVFTRPSSERIVPFADVASSCDVKIDQVELLAMKSFSLKVIRGSIDQLQQTLFFTWVQPRVLDAAQTTRLRDRLATWGREVSRTATDIEAQAPELLSQAVI